MRQGAQPDAARQEQPAGLSESPRQSEPRFIDRDLYCLKCGYNLRGLSGDPARCPECGFDNPIADTEIPADLIAAQIRRMETAPALALVCQLALLPGGILGYFAVSAADWWAATWIAIYMLLVSGCWLETVRRYRNSCLGKKGWLAALTGYQAAGLTMIGVTVAAPLAMLIELTFNPRRYAAISGLRDAAIQAAIVIAYFGGALYLDRRLYRAAKKRMEQLQREVAVEIARTEIRKRLVRGTRAWTLPG